MLAVFGAVALVGLLGMVMTTGDQVSQKIQMQNSVDAAALSGGAWIARGLNITSAFNLMQTQLVGGAILLQALDKTLPLLYLPLAINIVRWGKCAWRSLKCFTNLVINLAQLQILVWVQPIVHAIAVALARCPTGLFWLVAKALELVNAGIHYSFYLIGLAESYDVARASGAKWGILVPGPFFHGRIKLTMPTEKRPFREHCDPMENGSPSRRQRGYHPLIGYRVGEGPYSLGRDRLRWVVKAVGGVPSALSESIYNLITTLEKNAVCYGSRCSSIRPSPYLLDTANDGLSFLAVAYKSNRKIFFSGPRIKEPPAFYTYAQVEIYNGVNGSNPDAYTQDWRVRLAPASLIERPFESFASTPVGSALERFTLFVLTYLGVDVVNVGDFLWQVGNH